MDHDTQPNTGSLFEQAIWDFIAGSIYCDLGIYDYAELDDEWWSEFFPCADGSGTTDWSPENRMICPPKDEAWIESMTTWFEKIKSKSRGYLEHWQQLHQINWIIPNRASIGQCGGAEPMIGLDGQITNQKRYSCDDSLDCEWGAMERASEPEVHYGICYKQYISEIVGINVQANKANEKGNVQTASPSTN
tara:strand:- start:455 stop:1027 length:573 start_codon:yes stop_codon:yes gene_type:complete